MDGAIAGGRLPSVVTRTGERTSRAGYYYSKRAADSVLACLALIVLSPLLLVIAIAIRLDSKGPVLFVQQRIGSRRHVAAGRAIWEIRRFPVFKFRTMVHNADPMLHEQYIKAFVGGTLAAAEPGHPSYKLANDPRVTRVGHWLRRSSLDELPQLFNVLRGEMSLVGPRPVPEYEVAEYREAWRLERLATLPGITGWWQVTGRCQVEFDEMIRLDLEYVRKQSWWVDLKILFLTFPAVLSGAGAE